MRNRYDQELGQWKKQAVAYNDYQRYGTLFDREIPLAEKKSLMAEKQAPESEPGNQEPESEAKKNEVDKRY